jgi:hypothetical protein
MFLMIVSLTSLMQSSKLVYKGMGFYQCQTVNAFLCKPHHIKKEVQWSNGPNITLWLPYLFLFSLLTYAICTID